MAWPDLSDLRTRVRDMVNESTPVFFTDAFLNRVINDGERDVAIKGLCLEDIQSKTTIASTRTITVSCIKTLAVEYVPVSGTPVGLTKISPLMLGHMEVSGAAPQHWFKWGNRIGINPKPGATTYNLNVYTAILPGYEMSEDTDEPQVQREFIQLIVDYARYRCLMREKLWTQAAQIYSPYIEKLQTIRQSMIDKYKDRYTDLTIPDAVVTVYPNEGGAE